MATWFTVKVKYTKQMEDGRLKRVTEPYLIDAATFADAEQRMYEEMATRVRTETIVTGISKTEYADIFYYEDSDVWYKCKLSYITVDPDEGKEKKIVTNFLVTAHDVKDAYDRIHESLSEMTDSFDVASIMVTPIVEVLPYEPDLDVELKRRPMTDEEKVAYNAESYDDVNNEIVENETDLEVETGSRFVDETEEE